MEETDNVNIVFELVNYTEQPYKFKCLGLSSNTPGTYNPLPVDSPFVIDNDYELKEGKFPLVDINDFYETSKLTHKLGDTVVELITFDNYCTDLSSDEKCKIGVRIHKVEGGRRRKSKKSKKSKKTKKTKKSKKSKKTKKSRKH